MLSISIAELANDTFRNKAFIGGLRGGSTIKHVKELYMGKTGHSWTRIRLIRQDGEELSNEQTLREAEISEGDLLSAVI